MTRRAMTLFEVLMTLPLLGVMLVGALNMVGASRVGMATAVNRTKGALLAQELMSEIMQRSYEDPSETPTFGREPSESAALRKDYDDIDDYATLTEDPPKDRDGQTMADTQGWSRRVQVQYVDPNDPTQVVGSDMGAKRITVFVDYNALPVATLVAVRTRQ